jgi:rubrerythrin
MPESTKQKLRETKKNNPRPAWNKGVPRTEAEKQKMSITRRETAKKVGVWNQGKKHPKETLEKMSERAKNRKILTCEHCGKAATGANYYRWHHTNCKSYDAKVLDTCQIIR